MTFQDPQPQNLQPQSRRAARESERSAERETWGQDQPGVAPEPVGGRRAAQPAALPEPLTYVTQQRPKVPSYDGPSFRSRALTNDAPEPVSSVPSWADSSPVGSWADTPTQAIPAQERPNYRDRDFTPEGRRVAPPAFSPAPQPVGPGPVTSIDLDYVTQRPAGLRSTSGPSLELPPMPPESSTMTGSSEGPSGLTLTRRELRALRAAEDARSAAEQRAAAAPEPTGAQAVDFLLASGPIELPHLAERSAAPTPGAFAPAAVAADVVRTASEPLDDLKRNPFADLMPSHSFEQPPVVERTPEPAPAALVEPQAAARPPQLAGSFEAIGADSFELLFAQPDATPHRPEPAQQAPVQPAPAAAQEPAAFGLIPQSVPDAPELRSGRGDSFVQPSRTPGHWSSALDEEQPSGTGRVVGSSVNTTNALVLPSIPNAGDLSYSLATGEVLVTGSIDLPRSLGSTGAHPDQLDDVGIDHLLDPSDREVNTDSQPVRAAKAVSSHTSTRNMIVNAKPKGSRLPTVLLVLASVMAVVVVGLIVVTAVTGKL